MLDLVEDRGHRRAREQKPNGLVVAVGDNRAGVAAGRHGRGEYLIAEPRNAAVAVVDVDRSAHGGNAPGGNRAGGERI